MHARKRPSMIRSRFLDKKLSRKDIKNAEIRKKDLVRISLSENILPLRNSLLLFCSSVSDRIMRGDAQSPVIEQVNITEVILFIAGIIDTAGARRRKNRVSNSQMLRKFLILLAI